MEEERLTVYFPYMLSSKFVSQWREDMRQTPKVILECFRGLDKNDSWVILKRTQKEAFVGLKQNENDSREPALSGSRRRFI